MLKVVSLPAAGALVVVDTPSLDYETLTDGAPGPHWLIQVEAYDQQSESTYPDVDMLVFVTVLDVAEPPAFVALPAAVSVREDEQGAAGLLAARAVDEDIGGVLRYEVRAEPPSAVFDIHPTSRSQL